MVLVALATTSMIADSTSANRGRRRSVTVAAITPETVPESDLAAANTLRNTVDNVAVVAPPISSRAAAAALRLPRRRHAGAHCEA